MAPRRLAKEKQQSTRNPSVAQALKDPFVILLSLVIFFFVGRWIIISANAHEEEPLKNKLWQTVQNIKAGIYNDSLSQSPLAYCHRRVLLIFPSGSIAARDSLENSWRNWRQSLHLKTLTLSDPSIQMYGRNRFAIVTARYTLEGQYQAQPLPEQGALLANFVREQGRWWLVALHLQPRDSTNFKNR